MRCPVPRLPPGAVEPLASEYRTHALTLCPGVEALGMGKAGQTERKRPGGRRRAVETTTGAAKSGGGGGAKPPRPSVGPRPAVSRSTNHPRNQSGVESSARTLSPSVTPTARNCGSPPCPGRNRKANDSIPVGYAIHGKGISSPRDP